MKMPELFIRKRRISRHATFSLTPAGKAKAEEYSETPFGRILSALDELKTGNIDDIAEESRLSKRTVEKFMPRMIRGGYIHAVRTEETES